MQHQAQMLGLSNVRSKEKTKKPMKLKRLIPITNTLCVGGAIAAGAGSALADNSGMDELKARVAQLEALATKEGILPSGTPMPKFVSAMSDISMSGFVTASYF